jgi:hypothetical protein
MLFLLEYGLLMSDLHSGVETLCGPDGSPAGNLQTSSWSSVYGRRQ